MVISTIDLHYFMLDPAASDPTVSRKQQYVDPVSRIGFK